MSNPLFNAPPRVSDLSLDERKARMIERDNARRVHWLAMRERRGALAWLADFFRGA